MERLYRDKAIVLRQYKLGEADRIVVLLGKDCGQIRAVAKGIRKPTSRMGGRVSPFNLLEAQFHRGQNLDTITQSELVSGYADALSGDYYSFASAKLLAEVTQRMTDKDADSGTALFGLLHGALAALAGRRHHPQLIAASYLMRASGIGGWTAQLGCCASCAKKSSRVFFSPSQGGIVCEECIASTATPIEKETVTDLMALLAGRWELLDEECCDARRLLGLAGQWTQWHLEQQLKALPFALGATSVKSVEDK